MYTTEAARVPDINSAVFNLPRGDEWSLTYIE